MFLSIFTKVWVEHLIKLFGLKPSKEPLPLGFIGRKRGVDFRTTTLETFKRVIPSDHYRLHDDAHEIIFHETAKVYCGGLDNQERINKFNSAEFAFFAIDQAEETERTEVDVLSASLRLKVNGIQPPYKKLFTANPGDVWLKHDFIDAPTANQHFIPALHTDNPHLPTNYEQTLTQAFKHSPALLAAYRDGNWNALQSQNILITGKMLADLKGVVHHHKQIRRIIACDPALGGDECVIYAIENGAVIDQMILHERDEMKIAGNLRTMATKHDTPNYAIGSIGFNGLCSRLKELDPECRVFDINEAENAREEDSFRNVRAEMWWNLMKLMMDKKVPYPEDEALRDQLCSVRFKVINSNGCIQLDPKDETRKRLGRSPDRADAYVMGMYHLDDTEPIKARDAWGGYRRKSGIGAKQRSAMAA